MASLYSKKNSKIWYASWRTNGVTMGRSTGVPMKGESVNGVKETPSQARKRAQSVADAFESASKEDVSFAAGDGSHVFACDRGGSCPCREIVGHDSETSHQLYIRPSDDQRKEAMEKLSEMIVPSACSEDPIEVEKRDLVALCAERIPLLHASQLSEFRETLHWFGFLKS